MSKIYAFVPIFASAKHEIEKPSNWDDMTLEEKKDYFMEHAGNLASLCHHCSKDSELGEVDYKTYEDSKWWDESDFLEE